MVSIEDGLSADKHRRMFKEMGSKVMTDYLFLMFKDHFKTKTNKADLMICDLFCLESFDYAFRNQIKCLINSPFSYRVIQVLLNYPSLERSFGVGGFTVTYPHPLNPFFLMGFPRIIERIRYHNLMLINSTIGLEPGHTLPTHHILTGLLKSDPP